MWLGISTEVAFRQDFIEFTGFTVATLGLALSGMDVSLLNIGRQTF